MQNTVKVRIKQSLVSSCVFEGPKSCSFNKKQELLYYTTLVKHFLALRMLKVWRKMESDSVALEPEATYLHQPATVHGLRIPAETRSFISSSTDHLTQLYVFPGKACVYAQHHADAWRKCLHCEMQCSLRNSFEDLDWLEALRKSLWNAIRREVSLCSWWEERITELKMRLKLQFLILVCNVNLKIYRYAVDWSCWWAMQKRFEDSSLEGSEKHSRTSCLTSSLTVRSWSRNIIS